MIRKELTRTHFHFISLRLLKRKIIRRKVSMRKPNFSKRMINSIREIRIAESLFQRGMEKLLAVLALFFSEKSLNKQSQRKGARIRVSRQRP